MNYRKMKKMIMKDVPSETSEEGLSDGENMLGASAELSKEQVRTLLVQNVRSPKHLKRNV